MARSAGPWPRAPGGRNHSRARKHVLGPRRARGPRTTEALAGRHVELRWQAADARCPAVGELVARIEGLLVGAAVGLEADARVQPPGADPRWRLDLELRWPGGTDERTLHAHSCSELADATVILITVLAAPLTMAHNFVAPAADVAPTSASAAPVAAPVSTPTVDEELEPLLAAPVIPAPAGNLTRKPSPRRRGSFARVAAIAGYGILPRQDLGLQLALGGLLPRLRIEGAVTYLPGQAAILSDGRGATHSFAAGGLRVCPRFLGRPIELSLCGGLEVGARWGHSIELMPVRRAAGPWFALSLGAALDWWFSPQVALHAGFEGLGAPVDTAFSIGGEGLGGGRHFALRGVLGLAFALTQQKPTRPEK